MDETHFARSFTAEPYWSTQYPMVFAATWPAYKDGVAKVLGIYPLADDFLELGDYCMGEGVLAEVVSTLPYKHFMHRTLVHGDLRVDNAFFDWEAPGKIRKDARGDPMWCLIDFQLLTIVNPCFELAYFITQSLDADVQERGRACRRLHSIVHCIARVKLVHSYDIIRVLH